MPFELTKEYLEKIQAAISEQNNEFIRTEMEELFPADITNILYELEGEEAHYLVTLLDTKLAAEIIINLDPDDRKKFLKNFTSQQIAEYVDLLDSDDAVDILNEQPVNVREEVIALVSDREQARFIIDLLHYDEDCAGGLMQKELVKINVKQSVTECVEEIRRQAEDVENVYSVYVVDDEGTLLGRASLKKIILAKRGSKIADIFTDDIVSVKTTATGEEVADIMQKYDLDAVPVVNIQGRLLGRITIDDVVDFITEQAHEDVQAMAGISEDVEEDDSVWKLVRSRLPWLLIGMTGSFLAAKIIGVFDGEVARTPALAAFIPLIGSTGGNVGIQSSALIVQSLADKSGIDTSLTERLKKVLLVSLLNGLIAATFAFLGTLVLEHENTISLVMSLSIFSIVMLASFMGTITPLVLNQFDINPAVASGPFITTTNDLLGYGVYFLIVYMLI
ncbi:MULTISPECIES: magnesium transporter [Flectobacillus]|uniref:Magnesium transporter MgtE n=1 Tax=Flectobacillus roseus TaxID=502259 RepID=A0ABT6Y6T2_9BACT|nr:MULTISPECIES: magnesium transporter [Flectobacillus]MDI9859275.1 magnesium transporter [Flectobacillus roseus]MDI9868029.1 magnesium transporter [Flectobacillus roseus]NBA78189.1 magnesium transporter [Emticicia sp. ODNR4P]PAC27253.1 magnesium transporter [Flectobacillus sp. BAB-3569]